MTPEEKTEVPDDAGEWDEEWDETVGRTNEQIRQSLVKAKWNLTNDLGPFTSSL